MRRVLLFLISLAGVGVPLAYAQLKKQFTVENREDCKTVQLVLKSKTGNCFIRPSQHTELLNVYSNQDLEAYGHSFSNEIVDGKCAIRLAMQQSNEKGVGQKISYQMLGSDDRVTEEKFWKVYLTGEKPYSLDFDYGIGSANIDLSGLSVQKLKINTGSADVSVSYASGVQNQVEMDTFFVKVDLGSLRARQMNLSRSKVVLLDVGFGNMYLDFSDKPTVYNRIRGSVGAGNLIIQLPGEEVPVLVKITDSWLCSINLSRSLKKIGENTYANASYTKASKDVLTFDLDVSMGKIVFKERAR
jgi:hypothetical protein